MNPNLIHDHFRVYPAFEAIEMIQRFLIELFDNIQEREKNKDCSVMDLGEYSGRIHHHRYRYLKPF